MKSSRKSTVFSASTTTTEIPKTVDLPPSQLQSQAAAATRIQSHYKAHLVRTLYKKISSVNSEADSLQKLIQRQETVDAVRSDEREKLRLNEALMGLLLRLDSVPGVYPTVRDARRKASHRIVDLQEILDGICEAKLESDHYYCYHDYHTEMGWSPCNFDFDKMVEQLCEERGGKMVEQMEEQLCEERGGEEMEKFCAQYLGFRCFQRFLRE